MGAIYKNNVLYSGGAATANASQVLYDNRVSQLEARTIQEAIDKLNDSHNAINSVRYYEPTDMIQYQVSDGSWIDWKPGNERQLVLYSYGDQHSDITGGWTNQGWTVQTTSNAANGSNAILKSSSMNIKTTSTTAKSAGVIATAYQISLHGYNTLKALVSSNYGPTDVVNLHLTSSKCASWITTGLSDATVAWSAPTILSTDTVIELDVSNMSGEYYVVLSDALKTNGDANIMKVWLER